MYDFGVGYLTKNEWEVPTVFDSDSYGVFFFENLTPAKYVFKLVIQDYLDHLNRHISTS